MKYNWKLSAFTTLINNGWSKSEYFFRFYLFYYPQLIQQRWGEPAAYAHRKCSSKRVAVKAFNSIHLLCILFDWLIGLNSILLLLSFETYCGISWNRNDRDMTVDHTIISELRVNRIRSIPLQLDCETEEQSQRLKNVRWRSFPSRLQIPSVISIQIPTLTCQIRLHFQLRQMLY